MKAHVRLLFPQRSRKDVEETALRKKFSPLRFTNTMPNKLLGFIRLKPPGTVYVHIHRDILTSVGGFHFGTMASGSMHHQRDPCTFSALRHRCHAWVTSCTALQETGCRGKQRWACPWPATRRDATARQLCRAELQLGASTSPHHARASKSPTMINRCYDAGGFKVTVPDGRLLYPAIHPTRAGRNHQRPNTSNLAMMILVDT